MIGRRYLVIDCGEIKIGTKRGDAVVAFALPAQGRGEVVMLEDSLRRGSTVGDGVQQGWAHLDTAPKEVAVLALRELGPRSSGPLEERSSSSTAQTLHRFARRWFSRAKTTTSRAFVFGGSKMLPAGVEAIHRV